MSYVSTAFGYLKSVFTWQTEFVDARPATAVAMFWAVVLIAIVF